LAVLLLDPALVFCLFCGVAIFNFR